MPKRKSSSSEPTSFATPSLTSLDAALDLLACETFTRLSSLTSKFESAAGVKLNDGVIKRRWDEACMRYWLMKSMDDLSCASSSSLKNEVPMADDDTASGDCTLRSTPLNSSHPGAIATFGLNTEEALIWRRWSPKAGDMVLVELPSNAGIWPGKVIDKKVALQGRSLPRGNHFYAVRIYSEDIEPAVTIKSRMVPLSVRPSPPLLASTELLSAFNHASNPTTFDMVAAHRETAAAHARSHPGAGDDDVVARVKADKEQWLKFTNWLNEERRVEKLRALAEERERRLKAVTKSADTELEGLGELDDNDQCKPRKRRVTASIVPFTYVATSHHVQKIDGSPSERGGIFKLSTTTTPPRRYLEAEGSQSMSAYIRPALSAPYRSSSPRRMERRRNGIFNGAGEFSPRPRGLTYTPPRVLPNGDETAPFGSPSPAPSLKQFDFVSPLGPGKLRSLVHDADDDAIMLPKSGQGSSLEVVQEEGEEEANWTVVTHRRSHRRAGSAPVEKAGKSVVTTGASDDLMLA